MEPMIQEERAFSKMRTSAVQRLQNHLPREIAAKSGALFHSEKKHRCTRGTNKIKKKC